MYPYTRAEQRFTLAVALIAAAALVTLADRISWQQWQPLALYFFLLVLAYSIRIPGLGGISITPSAVLAYLAMYVFNPPTILLLFGTARAIGEVASRGWVPWRAVFNGSQAALSVALGALVFGMFGGAFERIDQPIAYLGFIAAPLVGQVANHFFVGYLVSQRQGTPFLITWFDGVWNLFWQNLLSIPTAIVLAVLYVKVHYAAVLGYVVLLRFQWLGLHLLSKRRQLHAQVVDGLVIATDFNFPLGKGHARRVADIAVAIAREMRLSESEVELVQFAALLHDVGMIGKDDVLDRPVVTMEDANDLRDHVRVGAEIARDLPRKEIAALILHHHEHYDGTGYPGELKGEAIPLGARIIALAEAIDSMASGSHPHTSAFALESILSYVASEKGRVFDPKVVEAFLRIAGRREFAPAAAEISDADQAGPTRLGSVPAR